LCKSLLSCDVRKHAKLTSCLVNFKAFLFKKYSSFDILPSRLLKSAINKCKSETLCITTKYHALLLIVNLFIVCTVFHVGTDISQSMIEYANMTYRDEKRLGFEVLDIQTKNLPEKYISEFDHIFSFHTLHWCYDIR
jgi:hypothetical protein